jgi:hypothetical protein
MKLDVFASAPQQQIVYASRLLLVHTTHRLQAVEQPMKPGLLPSPMWSIHDINHLI